MTEMSSGTVSAGTAQAGLELRFEVVGEHDRGGAVYLTATAASALNDAFGLPPGTIPAGLKLGDATVRYRLF